jgi:hypothetical protein
MTTLLRLRGILQPHTFQVQLDTMDGRQPLARPSNRDVLPSESYRSKCLEMHDLCIHALLSHVETSADH